MYQEKYKSSASLFSMNYIKKNSIIGIGTGSTILHFIKYLRKLKHCITGVVSSSIHSLNILKKYQFCILNCNNVEKIDVYIDSADEIDYNLMMIKGGGGALTGEKILASKSKQFICIVDDSKIVKKLGKFPIPIEVVPMSVSHIKKKLISLGCFPILRKNFTTDYGNKIIDAYNLKINNVLKLEEKLNSYPGIVTVGLFAKQSADICIISGKLGIKILKKNNKNS
ncbi:Ribose-5-phosphate isomerase A [Buchnera aphidicola (Anoecia corni)]|uniref:Ribose-5-phosphate isomerase A n=1 Tax=Buchnera aphidicola (Anoecia corni) TaxID=2994477 RepID=A0AAT9IH79_9GAMM